MSEPEGLAYLALHAHASLYVLLQLDGDGDVTCLQDWFVCARKQQHLQRNR